MLRCGRHPSRDWSEYAPTLPYLPEQPSPGRRHSVKADKPAEPGARSVSLDGVALVRPTRQRQANKIFCERRDRCQGCERNVDANRRQASRSNRFKNATKTAFIILAGSGNIDLQRVSEKAPAGEFTRCPCNPNSNNHNQHDGSPCFYLAILRRQPTSPSRSIFCVLRNRASRVSGPAMPPHADRSPMHRSTADALLDARRKQRARLAVQMTIRRIACAVHRIIYGPGMPVSLRLFVQFSEVMSQKRRGVLHSIDPKIEASLVVGLVLYPPAKFKIIALSTGLYRRRSRRSVSAVINRIAPPRVGVIPCIVDLTKCFRYDF